MNLIIALAIAVVAFIQFCIFAAMGVLERRIRYIEEKPFLVAREPGICVHQLDADEDWPSFPEKQ